VDAECFERELAARDEEPGLRHVEKAPESHRMDSGMSGALRAQTCRSAIRSRCTERTHRTSPDERHQARHIGTYALVAVDAHIAGSGALGAGALGVVLCGSGAHDRL
jgi:hypothetical protein